MFFEYNCIYLGEKQHIERIISELLKFNIHPEKESNIYILTKEFLLSLSNDNSSPKYSIPAHWRGVKLLLLSDIVDSVLSVYKEAADLLLIDERGKKGEFGQIKFEKVADAFQNFTTKDYNFPSKRILVLLPECQSTAKRSFELGSANLKNIIIEPITLPKVVSIALNDFQEFSSRKNKRALCISGGGLEGYAYSIGVISALEKVLNNFTCNDFDIYCGASSGAIVTSAIANKITVNDLLTQLQKKPGKLQPLTLRNIFDLATGEIIGRFKKALSSLTSFNLEEIIHNLQSAIPLGFFKGEKLRLFLEKQFRDLGLPNKFTELTKELYISVTDIDTREHIVLGEHPWADVPISQAVRASTALPPFFLPEKIKGHWFADGQLTSASDFHMAIKKGASLVIFIDPIVAFHSYTQGEVIDNGGYFTTVQAIKNLIQTRAISFIKHALDVNPQVDFLFFKPTKQLVPQMAGNPMKLIFNPLISDLAYKITLEEILENYTAYAHKLSKHEISLISKNEIRELLLIQKS